MRYEREIQWIVLRRRLHLPGAIHWPAFLRDFAFYGAFVLAFVLASPFALLAAFNINLVTFFVVAPHAIVEREGLFALFGAWLGVAVCAGLVTHCIREREMVWGILLALAVTAFLLALYFHASAATTTHICSQAYVSIAERISCHREYG